MAQKDWDALSIWLIDHGSNCDTWDISTRLEALSWIRSLRGVRDRPETPERHDSELDQVRRRAPGWGAN